MFMALASLLIMLYPGPGWEIVFVLCSPKLPRPLHASPAGLLAEKPESP